MKTKEFNPQRSLYYSLLLQQYGYRQAIKVLEVSRDIFAETLDGNTKKKIAKYKPRNLLNGQYRI